MFEISEPKELQYIFRRIIRRYHDKKDITIQDFTKCVTALERIPINLVHNHLIVAPSKIHGNGVFATQDIPANKIVTFYPYHSYCIEQDDENHCFISDDCTTEFSENIDKYQTFYTWGTDSEIFNTFGLTGDPFKKDNQYVGHLINDAVGNLFENVSFQALQEKPMIAHEICEKYYNLVDERANCEINNLDEFPIVFIRTIKPIKTGEELLTSYGKSYWYGNTFSEHVSNAEKELQDLLDRVVE